MLNNLKINSTVIKFNLFFTVFVGLIFLLNCASNKPCWVSKGTGICLGNEYFNRTYADFFVGQSSDGSNDSEKKSIAFARARIKLIEKIAKDIDLVVGGEYTDRAIRELKSSGSIQSEITRLVDELEYYPPVEGAKKYYCLIGLSGKSKTKIIKIIETTLREY